MEINVKKEDQYKDVSIQVDSTTIQLGLLNPEQSKELAMDLINAAAKLLDE